ncbi:MAG: J domain-containing protein [Candidatus Kapabacteria bacterium]|nr:J domain-containing protein [Candidatus Kapabacteria bacterium]
MGQLLDRLRNYVRASVSSGTGSSGKAWADRMIDSEDDELRRIIEELSSEPARGATSGSATSDSSFRRSTPPPDLPTDVVRAHTMLNVPVTADAAAIKQAYKTAIARWHPDRHASSSAEEQARAHQRAREINSAYATLKKFYSIT